MWAEQDQGVATFATNHTKTTYKWVAAHVQYHMWSGHKHKEEDAPFDKMAIHNQPFIEFDQLNCTLNQEQIQPVVRNILSTMVPGDTVVAAIPSSLWVGKPPCLQPNHTHVWMSINLISANTTGIQKTMQRATALKHKGTALFNREEWSEAASFYKEALRWALQCRNAMRNNIEPMTRENKGQEETKASTPQVDSDANQVEALRMKCHLNMASCHLNAKKPRRAVSRCNRALELDAHSMKGLVRRSKGYLQLHLFEKALDDLKTANRLYPTNELVLKQMKRTKKRQLAAKTAGNIHR
jgi:hypothetical protein